MPCTGSTLSKRAIFTRKTFIWSFVCESLAFTSSEETFLHEANASELIENHEEMFPRYYMHNNFHLHIHMLNHTMAYNPSEKV